MKNEKEIRNHGFSLIEVMVAMAIFSIGILSIGSLQIASTKNDASTRFATEAVTLAQDLVERLTAIRYDPTAPAPEFSSGSSHSPYAVSRYTVDWAVSAPDTPIANAVIITVFVRWRDLGRSKRINLNFIKVAGV